MTVDETILATFKSLDGDSIGSALRIPSDITPEQLSLLLNQLLENDDPQPYSFFVDDTEIVDTLKKDIIESLEKSTEDIVTIVYQPQATFRVNAVTRCSSTLSGHSEAVLSVVFSPNGRQLASASGDTTCRIWDLTSETPQFTCRGHTNWVLCLAWSPDGKMLASGGMDNVVILWDALSGKQIANLKGHRKWITSLSWEPFHKNPNCLRLASSSKDGTVKIWNAVHKRVELTLAQHTDAISCVKWGGDGLIYTASRDKTVKVWDDAGKLVKTLIGHAHWINTLALNTDFVLRTGAYDHTGTRPKDDGEAVDLARKRFEEARGAKGERLITGSDDFTLFLWEPAVSNKPIARMVGHQQLVNHVNFSPDGRLIASASFDKSVKLWSGVNGQFITTLRGHVGAVYQVTFSADSRLLLSGSRDSTLKVWDMKTKKLKFDLPGHADEVFTVDWSPSGDSKVASGGKDKMLKFWR